jgi:hypothetical protein
MTTRSVLAKFSAVQMIDVRIPTAGVLFCAAPDAVIDDHTLYDCHDLLLEQPPLTARRSALHGRGDSGGGGIHPGRSGRSQDFVSAEKFRGFSSRKDIRVFACFIEGPPGEIELADHYIEIWRRWNTNPSRSATIAWEDLFDVPRGLSHTTVASTLGAAQRVCI